MHYSPHFLPRLKHSQYFFRHPVFLHMHPTALDRSRASKALGFFSIISSIMLDLTSSYSELLLHPSQLQPLQYWPELRHNNLFQNIRNIVSGTLSSCNCIWNSLYLNLHCSLRPECTLWISSFWGPAGRLGFGIFLPTSIANLSQWASLKLCSFPIEIPITSFGLDGFSRCLRWVEAPLRKISLIKTLENLKNEIF